MLIYCIQAAIDPVIHPWKYRRCWPFL